MGKQLNQAARMLGRKGGLIAAQNLTPEQRRQRGVRGMQVRWARQTDADLLRLLPKVRDLDLIPVVDRKRGKASAYPLGGVLSAEDSSGAREA